MAIIKTFPKELLVTIESSGEYCDAHPMAELEAMFRNAEWGNGKKVAVYRLVEIKTLKVSVELVK